MSVPEDMFYLTPKWNNKLKIKYIDFQFDRSGCQDVANKYKCFNITILLPPYWKSSLILVHILVMLKHEHICK